MSRTNEPTKYCKDCKFYRNLGRWGRLCESPCRIKVSVVLGEFNIERDPEVARKDQYDCGPSGGWFEPKPWWRKFLW